MDDLISRQTAIDAVKKYRNGSDMPDMWYDGMSCALRCIYQLPSARPRMKGKWVREKYTDGGWYYRCSNCNTEPLRDKWTKHEVLSDYCPWCGADMRGEQE